MVKKTLEEMKSQLDTKSHGDLKCSDHYQTGIYCDRISFYNRRKPTRAELAEMDDFVKANGLEAKDYRIYEGLGFGLSVIALNLEMYIGLPAFGIVKFIQLRKN